MNTPNNNPEKNTAGIEQPSYSTLSVTPERKVKKRKKSFFKNQLKMLVIIGAAIVVLAVGVGVAAYLIGDGDGIIDTFTESRTDKEQGKITYTYHSRADGSGFVITDTAGKALESYYVDENGNRIETADEKSTLVFETAIGSLLKLSGSGKITYYALVDYDGKYIGGDTDCRVLVFPSVDQAHIAKISVFNRSGENGAAVEFELIGIDSNGDGKNDRLQLKGYEKATLNQLVAASICSYGGYTLALKKLSLDFMEAYDIEHAEDEGYVPLLDENNKIRFSEYGLDAESASYYEITTVDGKKHRLYIGDITPNGGGFYVRYYNEEEGDRNAVYRLSDDSGIGNMFGVEISRSSLFLSPPEDLVYAQINYPVTMTTYLMSESFKSYMQDPSSEDGYRKVIDFSYTDLEDRKYSVFQSDPYVLNDKSVLSGYMLDYDKVSEALKDLYDVSTLLSSDYSDTSVKNYVSVKKLVQNVTSGAGTRPLPSNFSTTQKYKEEFDKYAASVEAAVNKAVDEDGALYQLLDAYGLAEPEYKFSYYSTAYASGNTRLPLEFNCVWVSELTENNTYYVWAPMYQQVVELGYQYLSFLNWDSFDWISEDIIQIPIGYIDSLRVTGTDKDGKPQDVLFELLSSYNLAWSTGFVTSYQRPYSDMVDSSIFNVTAGLGYDGKKTLDIRSTIKYTVQARNKETGEIEDHTVTLSVPLLSDIDLAVVKTYCKWACSSDPGVFFENLSYEMQQSLNAYASSNPTVRPNGSVVEIVHLITDAEAIKSGNHYLDAKNYTVTISYDMNTDNLTVSAGHQGQAAPLVFDEKVFDDYMVLKVKNNSQAAADKIAKLTEADIAKVQELYASISGLNSEQKRLRITIFGAGGETVSTNEYIYDPDNENAEGSRYISAFKKFYSTMVYASYGGYATEAETVGGAKLTEEQMEAYQAQGDNCDLKIDLRLCLDDLKYIYRMYNYSSSKSYITVEGKETDGGEGMFFILRTRVDKLLSDALRATQGDTTIKGDQIY